MLLTALALAAALPSAVAPPAQSPSAATPPRPIREAGLIGDLYRPDTESRRPALLGWSPYNKDLMPTGVPAPFNEPGDVTYLAGCGYPVLVVNARGTGRSGGTLPAEMFGPTELADLRATIDWIAHRPWCDGRVAMTGMSYFSISQVFAAGHRIPGLAAIAPRVMIAVDSEYADDDRELTPGASLAVIPPVSGG